MFVYKIECQSTEHIAIINVFQKICISHSACDLKAQLIFRKLKTFHSDVKRVHFRWKSFYDFNFITIDVYGCREIDPQKVPVIFAFIAFNIIIWGLSEGILSNTWAESFRA